MAGAIKAIGEKITVSSQLQTKGLMVYQNILMLQAHTDTQRLNLKPTPVSTFVEFLLGAVRGQSGSAGFRQGLSM